MLKQLRSIGLALAAIGLFACNQSDKPTAPKKGQAETGAARVLLPAVPKEFAVRTAAGAQVLFSLTISGDDMAPMVQSWWLTSGQPQNVFVGNIPAGYPRYFEGRIILFDSATGDTTLSHEGMQLVNIVRDSIANVVLYLHQVANGGGGAQVCIQVEGWPMDSSCVQPPIPVPVPWVGGCYTIFVTGKAGGGRDTLISLGMRMDQWDSSLTAILTWPNGSVDSAYGYITGDGLVQVGMWGGGFSLSATIETSGNDTTFNRSLHGWFNDSLHHVYGTMSAYQHMCDTLVIWPPDPVPAPICYSVTQTLPGKTIGGNLFILYNGLYMWGTFEWKGFPDMSAFADPIPGGFDPPFGDTTLRASAPKGMITGVPVGDSLIYKADFGPDSLSRGNIYRLAPAGWTDAGHFTGFRQVCPEVDTLTSW